MHWVLAKPRQFETKDGSTGSVHSGGQAFLGACELKLMNQWTLFENVYMKLFIFQWYHLPSLPC